MGTMGGMLLTGGWARLARRWLAWLALLVVSASAGIAVALLVTPMQTVTVAGQVIQVGASAPSLACPARDRSTCSARACRPT